MVGKDGIHPITGSTGLWSNGTTVRAIRCDANGRLEVVVGGGVPFDVNVAEIAGTATVTAGVNGLQAIGGTQAVETAAKDVSFPVNIAGVVREALVAITDGYTTHILADTLGRLYTRTAGYDALLDAVKVSTLNTIASDRDEAAQVWADLTDVAAAVQYYPSANGHEVGNRTNIGIVLALTDAIFDVEVSNDGTTWINATKTVVDVSEGSNGFDNTHYDTGAGAAANWAIAWEKIEFRYIRIAFDAYDATNEVEITAMTRAH